MKHFLFSYMETVFHQEYRSGLSPNNYGPAQNLMNRDREFENSRK